MLSHKDADRYKVLHTSLSKPDVKQAQVVVAESQAVITDIQEAEDSLYVQMRDGAVDRLYRLGYEAGAKLEPVALPEEGSIQMYESDPRLPGIVFSVTGWTKAARIFQYDPKENSVTDTKLRPVGRFDAPADLEAEEVKVPAKDGTLIPVSIIHKRGIKLDGSNPTLMEGYGGYGISLDPFFDPIFLAWYEQGGIYAVAHVRGGGEYGEGWHLAGQKLTKPNTWNDFIACGEYLVAKGYTSTPKLAGWGVSAGGILIGRAITARPDLFGAAIIEVGFTDTLRGEFEQNGPGEISEWGTVKEPEGFKALYEMSAYAHVTNGTSYPATLLITGSNDPRVWPAEPAKMTARLQAATSSGKPVLLRVDYEAGHGIGSTKKQQEERLGDTFAFLLWQLGVAGFEPKAAPSTARAQ
jgi:prolyl oligopeptidase